MFYTVLFSLVAILAVVAGVTVLSRNRRELAAERRSEHPKDAARRQRKAKRAPSRNARRQRH